MSGSVRVLIQFDVCEELRLDVLQQTVGSRTLQQPSMKQVAPAYVRYQRPPVIEPIEPLVLESGERLAAEIKYYDYGVVSIGFQLPFAGAWEKLVQLASRWVWDMDFASRAEPMVRQKLARAADAMVKPYSRWLSEDYFIFHIADAPGMPNSADLTREYGMQIAQVVRGEKQALSEYELSLIHISEPTRP